MLSSVPYGLLPDYYKQLGKDAEFVYSGSFWETSLPYPGNQQFVTAYEKEFKRTPAVQSAGAYAACRLLAETVQRTGSLDSDRLREALLTLRTKTVLATSRSMSVASKRPPKRSPSSGRTANRWWCGRMM